MKNQPSKSSAAAVADSAATVAVRIEADNKCLKVIRISVLLVLLDDDFNGLIALAAYVDAGGQVV